MGSLIISPHLDDEVLGCASFLRDLGLTLCYVTHLHPAWSDGTTVRENAQLLEWLGVDDGVRLHMPANVLDTLPSHDLFTRFEKLINEVEPDTVLIPFPSFNQDHRAVYEAALTAMRPHDTHWPVNRILVYEQIEVFGTMRKVEPFRPTYFRELDIGFKLRALAFYESQARGHRSPERIKAMARVRGYQANREFAEAFEVVRWVE